MTYLSICIMYGTIPQVDKDSTQSYKILYKKKSMQYIKSIHRQIQKLNENHRGFFGISSKQRYPFFWNQGRNDIFLCSSPFVYF